MSTFRCLAKVDLKVLEKLVARSVADTKSRYPASTEPRRCQKGYVAIMSMSLDGYVADLNDGVAEVFAWVLELG